MARVDAAGGRRLHVGQRARLGVDGEGDERVRGHDGAVGELELERRLVPRRDGQELVVGLFLVGEASVSLFFSFYFSFLLRLERFKSG